MIDWAVLMRAGMGQRGLLPSEFWALTPAELMMVLGRHVTIVPMARDRLDELARQWPDTKGKDDG